MKNIKIEKISDRIFHLMADCPKKLAMAFLRIQEYAEHPFFKDRIFTHKEFEEWYVREHGSFSYHEDWSGFNVPSTAIAPFLDGRFEDITELESVILDAVRGTDGLYSVIGTCTKEEDEETFKHELAHALYFTEPAYRREVNDYLMENFEDFWHVREYVSKMLYHPSVYADEVHAYSSSDYEWLTEDQGVELKREHFNFLSDLRDFYAAKGVL